MSASNMFGGVGVALVTPFNEHKEIDFEAYEKLLNHVVEGGVDFVVVMGTTGEAPTISFEERVKILEFTKNHLQDKIPIVIGIGGNNTANLIQQISDYNLNGVHGILSSSPNYNKPSQAGIYEHYKLIAQNSPLPIILYNVPGRTASNITSATTLKLAHSFENIVAIKEASGNLVQCMEIVRDKPDNFTVVSGDDVLTLPMLSFGMDGVISVIANALPSQFSTMIHNGLNGNYAAARNDHLALTAIMQDIFSDGNPGGIKAALHYLNICEEFVRLPLVPIRDEIRNTIIDELKKLEMH